MRGVPPSRGRETGGPSAGGETERRGKGTDMVETMKMFELGLWREGTTKAMNIPNMRKWVDRVKKDEEGRIRAVSTRGSRLLASARGAWPLPHGDCAPRCLRLRLGGTRGAGRDQERRRGGKEGGTR